MKKLVVFFTAVLFGVNSLSAQGVDFGITGGLMNTNADIDISVIGFNLASIDAVNETGFYVGVIVDIEAADKFHVQPELTYGSAGDLSFFYLPVMAKYYVADKFHIMAGPQLTFSSNLGDIKEAIRDISGVFNAGDDLDDVLNSTQFDFGFGAGYDINDNFRAQARYAIPLGDIYDGPLGGSLDIKNSTLQVGVAYFF